MSLARRHQARILAAQAAILPAGRGATAGSPAVASLSTIADTAVRMHQVLTAVSQASQAASAMAAQMAMRLTHDLRRLKEIRSVAGKIAAKREMLPEYAAWVRGLLTGAEQAGAGTSGDVLPTVMIWRIDVGDFAGAMPLIAHVLRHHVPLPSRYERDAPSLIVEEIAEAALKAQAADEPFDLAVLEEVEALTASDDMHDQIRAKLKKAIGVELDRAALVAAHEGGEPLPLLCRSIEKLKAAQALHDRVGVKTIIKAAEKRLAAVQQPPAGTAG